MKDDQVPLEYLTPDQIRERFREQYTGGGRIYRRAWRIVVILAILGGWAALAWILARLPVIRRLLLRLHSSRARLRWWLARRPFAVVRRAR